MGKMVPADYRALLRSGRWFRALPGPLQDALIAAGRVESFAPGDRLFLRGDAPSGLFAVLAGGVRVSAPSEEGTEALLTLVEPPAWLGEISLFDGLPRTHDAFAEGEVVVLYVPQAALDSIVAATPAYWRDLALLMTHKIRLIFHVIEEATVLPIPVRLARRLVHMAEGYGEWHGRTSRVLAVKQDQLAAMLAISRQTANRALRRLEASGVVRLTYGEVEILDHAGLRKAAKLG